MDKKQLELVKAVAKTTEIGREVLRAVNRVKRTARQIEKTARAAEKISKGGH